MEEIAGWVAPIATAIAAMMTAANLGPRVTGWGFVVFTIGAIAWVTVGLASGQTNLAASNAFLLVVDVIGIWRWLGRQARFADGASAAAAGSARAAAPSLFPVGSIADAVFRDGEGRIVARGVDAMAECDSGRIAYVVLREGGAGGIGERLHAIDWADVRRCDGGFETVPDADMLAALPAIAEGHWPDRAPPRIAGRH